MNRDSSDPTQFTACLFESQTKSEAHSADEMCGIFLFALTICGLICSLGMEIKDYESNASRNLSQNHKGEIIFDFHLGDIIVKRLSCS